MFRTFLSLVLAGLLAHGLLPAQARATQSNDDAQTVEKVKLKVAKLGVGERARVTVRMKDGRKIKGFISQAGADDFTVRDRKTGDPTTVSYGDVIKVEDNRGHSTARNLGIGIGIGAGAFLAVLAIIFASLND